jgi:iron complex outermembrane recepter protein
MILELFDWETHMAKRLALICSLFLFIGLAAAEEPAPLANTTTAAVDTPHYVSPMEVVVTTSRTPLTVRETAAAVSVVGAEYLKAMPRTIAVDEALRLVPGVRIDNQADGSRVHLAIRGQGILTERGIRGTKVLLDGIPLNDPSGFAPDFYDVDWATVERVEVLRGPAAALYGSGGSAGVINIVTKDGGAAPLAVDLMGMAGSHDFWKSFAQMSGTQNGVSYRASASRMMGDGYRHHTRFWGNNLYFKAHTTTHGINLMPIIAGTDFYNDNAEGLNVDQVKENPRMANPDAIPFNEYMRTGRITAGVVGSAKMSDNQDVQFQAAYRATRFTEAVPSAVAQRDMAFPGASLQYTLHLGHGSIKSHVSAAVDAGWQTIKEERFMNLGGALEGAQLSRQTIQQSGIGVSLTDQMEFGPRWSGMASVRYDAVKNKLTDHWAQPTDLSGTANFEKATGRLGFTYSPRTDLNLYASVGQGFLPPATEELINNPNQQGGFNQDLKSATSQSEEIGARGSLCKTLNYDVALFYLTTDKDFDRYRMTARPLETFYRNLGHSRRIGAETALMWTPIKPLDVKLAYTYSNFKYTKPDSIKDNWLPNCPQHQLMADVEFRPVRHVTLGLSSETQTEWQIDTKNSVKQDGFTLVSARAAWSWTLGSLPGELFVSARNIFGEKYIAFTEPDPDGNSYQPGPTQEVFAGMKVNF